MAGRRQTQDQANERVEYILQLRTKGEKGYSALLYAWKEKYNLSEGQFKVDYSKARAIIAEYFQKDIQELSEELALHLWDLYAKSMKLQDYRECRAILKQIADLTISVNASAQNQKPERPKSALMAMRNAK